jgi:predicted RNA-binding Zn ribbon-like protein
MTFKYVSGRHCLDFAGTLKYRTSLREEMLTAPQLLSDWAVGAGLVDAAIDASAEDLAAAIALREAVYGIVVARLENRAPEGADVDVVTRHASLPQLTPRLHVDGSVSRHGTVAQLLAMLAADVLDLLAGPDIEKVKGCADPGCTRLYIDASRGHNRHWCGMGSCGNRAKVQAFRARQKAASEPA